MKNNWFQLGVFAVLAGGLVALILKGQDTSTYVAFLGPMVAGLFVVNQVDKRSDTQDTKLQEIHHNTNGVLEQRIKDAVSKALDERAGPPAPPAA